MDLARGAGFVEKWTVEQLCRNVEQQQKAENNVVLLIGDIPGHTRTE